MTTWTQDSLDFEVFQTSEPVVLNKAETNGVIDWETEAAVEVDRYTAEDFLPGNVVDGSLTPGQGTLF